ncbi:ABC transporter substrate-binding protein [Clostridia bacterium]|nr:ABC transporter substrate-binding protein [Clostridia bacterium]
MRKFLSGITALALALSVVTPPAFAASQLDRSDIEDILSTYSVGGAVPSYSAYEKLYANARPDKEITISASDYVRYLSGDESAVPETDGTDVVTAEDALIEYDFTVAEEGYYEMSIVYNPIEGKGAEIQRSFFLDGELPYRELALVQFSRVWQNKMAYGQDSAVSLTWEKDNQGNDLKPTMKENPQWIDTYVYDSDGYVTRPLTLHLTAGTHTLTIHSIREPMLLRSVTLSNGEDEKPYAEVKAALDASGAKDSSGQIITIEGEDALRTSSQMLYPVQDQGSPAITPSSPKELLNNSIGGNPWRLTGQWVEWVFDVEQAGYYYIGMHDKQNFKRGIYVSRKITIDGEVPFSELLDYGFKYTQNWRYETLNTTSDKDGEAYKVYLTAGSHTLRMEAVLGDFAEIVATVRDAVYELNAIYREVIRLTGTAPDTNRDYQIERSLPLLSSEMAAVRDALTGTIDELRRVAGRGSDRERVLITMRDQLTLLINDNERFGKQVNAFRVNVRACGTWLNEAMSQPLQIDRIDFYSPDVTVKIPNNTVFDGVGYEFSRLFYSFVVNYNAIGNVAAADDSKTITLWVGSGRDQANVVKSLIDEYFTKETGVSVNLLLVDMGTLLQATLAGQGPDVAIQVGGDLPMNYGTRDAVADLSQFADLDEVRTWFAPSAMVPYEYNGQTFGLPETQAFPMLFYRKDILAELKLELPQTWDDINVTMAVLAHNQMELGVLPAEPIFAMLLYQNGGEYYNAKATRSALDSEEAVNAFKQYSELYTDYKLDRATSVEERFRTGETPIIIQDYSFYNNLQVSAPDIKGIWGMAPVPGTLKEDGTIDRSVGSYGSACVMMEASEKKNETWEFMKWWTSAETQIMFGREMESLMGSAARVPTANIEAFKTMPWPVADFKALEYQFGWAKGIPQVPGGYFSWRNVNNAFYSVTTLESERALGEENAISTPREALTDKVILINDEIRYKRTEFGLPLE